MKTVLLPEMPRLLFSKDIPELQSYLGGPALFKLEGMRSPALVISTLLHGDEHTGFLALRKWLEPYISGRKTLPRTIWIFIGNTQAAALGVRRLESQPDYNRIWRNHESPEGKMAREVMNCLRNEGVFAAIDIHNNSGRNPHYACVSKWEHNHLHLASLFGRTIVHAEQPAESFTHAFSDFAPAVTLECGISGDALGTQHVVEFLEACLHLSHFPMHPVSPRDVDTYETVAHVKVRPGTRLEFHDDGEAELVLRSDLEDLNFSDLRTGTSLGFYRGTTPPLVVGNLAGADPGLLSFKDGHILTARELTPAMFTLSKKAIFLDCLGYLMIHKPVLTALP